MHREKIRDIFGMMINIDAVVMKRYSFLLSAFSAVLAGCSMDRLESSEALPVKHTSEIVAVLSSGDTETRMVFQEDTNENDRLYLSASWSDSDAITITPNASDRDAAVEFILVDGQDTETGRFCSEEEMTAESQNWTVYYPSSVQCDSDFKNFSFDGQVQNGDDNMDHLSAYNLMRKKYSFSSAQQMPSDLELYGDEFEQSACCKFSFSEIPEEIVPATLTFRMSSLTSYSSNVNPNPRMVRESFFEQTMSFTGMKPSKSFTAYMMIPPKRIEVENRRYITFIITTEDGRRYITERRIASETATVLLPGKYNTFKIYKNWVHDTGLDGSWGTFQTPTASDMKKQDCNIVIMGDGYTEEDYQGENGKFYNDAKTAYEALFSIEPYKDLKEYFGSLANIRV